MSVLDRLASALGRRDDEPNKQLARELAEAQARDEIRELIANLHNPNPKIQSDCIKVLYEIGYIAPHLIAEYAPEFLALLKSKNNRLVWGGMCALATIAPLQADLLYAHRQEIQQAIDHGSVITVDRGIKTLAAIAAQNPDYRAAIMPYLLEHLKTCRPKDVPLRGEAILQAVDPATKTAFVEVLQARLADLRPAQAKRVRRVIEKAKSVA